MTLTALEFYSGIGGMHYALKAVVPSAVILAAFDINHAANRCYEHNFGTAPRQVDIEHITAAELDAHAADLWLLAPPCQPFTRQGMQLGAQDNRSRSFLNILDQIRAMQRPPRSLLLENVVGFETSDMRALLAERLAAAGYHVAEFILTPTQYGIPYSRPRYFCLASKQPLPVSLPSTVQPCRCTPSLLLQLKGRQAGEQTLTAAAQQTLASHVMCVQSISKFLQSVQQQQQHAPTTTSIGSASAGQGNGQQQPSEQEHHQHCYQHHQEQAQQHVVMSGMNSGGSGSSRAAQAGEMAATEDPLAAAWVPDDVIRKHAEVIDVVTAASRTCNCFTKAYGKLARGAGSMLATVDPTTVDNRWRLVGGTGSLYYEGYMSSPGGSSTVPITGSSYQAVCSTFKGTAAAFFEIDRTRAGHTAAAAATATAAEAPSLAAGSQNTCPLLPATGKDSLAGAWRRLRLRYFMPREVAHFHTFPDSFSFPPGMTPRQCYQLLGNSLSVAVVADLLKFLLCSA